MDSADKATNKALSAAYKYACIEAFCIPTEGEQDADKTTHDETLPVAQKALLVPKLDQQSRLDSYTDHKAEYAIAAPVLKDGALDYDAFGADLEIALSGAKTMHDVSMIKKANARVLNAMKVDRPEMFEFLKDLFQQSVHR